MNDYPNLFAFPQITDEAVIALNYFLEQLTTQFQNHYFAQMHRYYADLPDPALCKPPIQLPLVDPPF